MRTDLDRKPYFTFTEALKHPGDFAPYISTFFGSDASINVVHSFNYCAGPDAYLADVIAPLQTAFDELYRRDDIVMAGRFEGADWISATGYYVGHFARDWIGIRAPGKLCYLRFGEFHRMDGGKSVESFVFLDIPELMIACNQWPIATGPGQTRGHTGIIQGPASHDGILLSAGDPLEAEKSYQIVSDMLLKLAAEDEAWRPYWHDNMMWYGPGAFGSFVGIEEFAGFQLPFESQFDGSSGGSSNNGMTWHFTRYGDGDYTCSCGWPSLTSVNVKPFLEQPVSNERVFFRVCDWWRFVGDLLAENWVFVDIPHALLQPGFDIFADLRSTD
jgi:hypothetical protein